MTDAKHTPGEWFCSGRSSSGLIFIGTFSETKSNQLSRGPHVARVFGAPGGKPDEGVANARLIAAAPDLLDALEGLMRSTGALHGSSVADTPAEKTARAALAKAKGEAHGDV